MTTGKVENFAGNISELGPVYPFAGWEWLLVLLGVIFWIGWHIWQYRIEKKEYEEEIKKCRDKEILERVFGRNKGDPGC